MNSPFFIVGVPRSGTTLLSVLLNNHPKIYIDKDSVGISVIQTIRRFKKQYAYHPGQDHLRLLSDLAEDSYKQRLTTLLDADRIGEFSSLQSFFRHSVEKKLTEKGKQVWGDKTPELSNYIPEIKAAFPQARIIHIVRNPFANCKSLKERQYINIKLAAQQWKDTNAQGLIERYIYGPEQYLLIRYEDLITDPEPTLDRVCAFLGVPYKGEMLRLDQAKSTQTPGAYVEKSFNAKKIDAWKEALSDPEKRAVERIAGDLMTKFGYQPHFGIPPEEIRSLSYRNRLWLRSGDIFRLIFKRDRVTMTGRKLVPVKISMKKRITDASGQWIRLFFSEDIYHSFLEIFRREYQTPKNKTSLSNLKKDDGHQA